MSLASFEAIFDLGVNASRNWCNVVKVEWNARHNDVNKNWQVAATANMHYVVNRLQQDEIFVTSNTTCDTPEHQRCKKNVS